MSARVAVLVPNYKTLELTQLCLRLLRKHSDRDLLRVIAIDNASADASTDYLRSLSWIDLIEREAIPGETPSASHARALDLALEEVEEEFVLSIHTDTLVRKSGWDHFLLGQMGEDPRRAGLGSWKLELKPWPKRFAKKIEATWQTLTGRAYRHSERHYLRSHCALYRTAVLREHGLHFHLDEATAGQAMHYRLEELGYEMKFLSSEELIPWLVHVNHATMVLRPELGAREKTRVVGMRRIEKFLNEPDIKRLRTDSSADS
jgi:glycosyl transferase family 2